MAPPVIDITGLRFGRLLAVKRVAPVDRFAVWLLRCDCGVEVVKRGSDLRAGYVQSCGCFRRDNTRELNLSHSHKEGRRPSRSYGTWQAMKARCENPRHKGYRLYGERGITICNRWRDSFAAFLEDMGERPEGRTLDRINPNGNYEPGNCRWATPKEQAANTRGRNRDGGKEDGG